MPLKATVARRKDLFKEEKTCYQDCVIKFQVHGRRMVYKSFTEDAKASQTVIMLTVTTCA